MMRIVAIIAVTLVAFGGGFAGVYFNMPAPAATEAQDEPAENKPPTPIPAEAGVALPDSIDLRELGDSGEIPSWVADLSSRSKLVPSLIDSLTASRSQLRLAEFRVTELEARIARLEEEARQRASRKEVALALASTLPKLEPKELNPILEGLDDQALFDLYEAASARNRPTILAGLKPERAAFLVQSLMAPASATTSVTPPSQGQ